MEIKIGFKFSKQYENLGTKYWKTYEVVGFRYGSSEGESNFYWKTRDDVLKLKKYIQIIDLPYPNYNGLKGIYNNMENTQLSITWIGLKILEKDIKDDMKLLPEFRIYKIDDNENI